jgi:hypothetical protein
VAAVAVAVAALVVTAGTRYLTSSRPLAVEVEVRILALVVATAAAAVVGSMADAEEVACSPHRQASLVSTGVAIQEGAAPAAHGMQVVAAVQEVLGSVARAVCVATAELVWPAISLGRSFITQAVAAVDHTTHGALVVGESAALEAAALTVAQPIRMAWQDWMGLEAAVEEGPRPRVTVEWVVTEAVALSSCRAALLYHRHRSLQRHRSYRHLLHRSPLC